jgi:hypothetical protein
MQSDKFLVFVESLRDENNTDTIEAIVNGYNSLVEAGLLDRVKKAALPAAMAAGILGAGISTGALDDSDLMKYEQSEHERMKYSTSDLSNLVKEHEAAIKSGDKQRRAVAYDALKAANVAVGYNKESGVKFYWDKNLGRAFYPDGSEVPSEERPYLPTLGN